MYYTYIAVNILLVIQPPLCIAQSTVYEFYTYAKIILLLPLLSTPFTHCCNLALVLTASKIQYYTPFLSCIVHCVSSTRCCVNKKITF
jgi:hypothetical protein